MKLTVLIDNNTFIDQYFFGEPGLALFIGDEGTRILFDTGYLDAFIRNAQKLNLNLLDLDTLVLSHGHLDHTWGLVPLLLLFTEGMTGKSIGKKPVLVAHPQVFNSRFLDDLPEIGSLLNENELGRFFDLRLSREQVHLTDRLVYLGEIARTNDFESQSPLGKILVDGVEKDDFLLDDSALAYRSPEGLVIITGCSHAGICNIVEQAKKVCGDDRVVDIIGGFHLLEPSPAQLNGTAAYLEKLGPKHVHACHCTDLKSKIALARVVDIKETGAGLVLEY